jgi:hypothetical protein
MLAGGLVGFACYFKFIRTNFVNLLDNWQIGLVNQYIII